MAADHTLTAPRAGALPPLGPREDGLSPGQRRVMVGAIAGLHVAAIWGLLQIREVREAVAEAAPMFVSLVAPEKPKTIEPPPPPPPPPPKPIPKREPPPIVTAAPTPSPTPPVFVAPPPPVDPVPPSPPMPVEAPPAPPAPVAPPPPAPKFIPPSAVQYLRLPEATYPQLSRRTREQGRVVVIAWADEQGLPQRLRVSTSSGFPRLDAAALAAVEKARFKPYTENGKAVAGWVYVPIEFTLDN